MAAARVHAGKKGGEGLWKKACPEKQLKNTHPPGINHLSRRHSRQRGESRTAERLCLWFVVIVLFLRSDFWLLFKVVLPRNKVATLLTVQTSAAFKSGDFCKYSQA